MPRFDDFQGRLKDSYLENRWDGLKVFLTRPEVPITSHGFERVLRGPVVARKVSLDSRSKRGIEATSVMLSLIESAKLRGFEPTAYLREALHAALDGAIILLPHELA